MIAHVPLPSYDAPMHPRAPPRTRLSCAVLLLLVVACVPSPSGTVDGDSCAALSVCCSHVPASEQPACLNIAASGIGTNCYANLASYQATGACSEDAGLMREAASPVEPDVGVTDETSCRSLTTCCLELPSTAAPACLEVAGAGVANPCASLLTQYETGNECGNTTLPSAAEPVPHGYDPPGETCDGQTFVTGETPLCAEDAPGAMTAPSVGPTWFLCNGGEYTEYDCSSPGAGWEEAPVQMSGG